MSKKLGTLAALGLCFTVGGVYATWSYASGTATGAGADNAVIVAIAETESTPKGTIAVDSNNLKITLDQKADGDYTVVSKMEGSIKVTYTPDTAHGSEYTAIEMQCVITYTEENAYTYGEGISALFTVTTDTLYSEGAVAEWVIDASDLISCIQVASFKLPKLSAYNDFNDKVLTNATKAPTFKFTFSEKV